MATVTHNTKQTIILLQQDTEHALLRLSLIRKK